MIGLHYWTTGTDGAPDRFTELQEFKQYQKEVGNIRKDLKEDYCICTLVLLVY